MASLSAAGPKKWRVQWQDISGNGRRQIRLSGITRKQAEGQFARIESLISTRLQGAAVTDVDAAWLGQLPDKFHAKLAKAGLVEPREVIEPEPEVETLTLNAFLQEFIDRGLTHKNEPASESTLKKWRQTRDLLVDCFGSEKPIESFDETDGEGFRKWMEKRRIRKSVRNSSGRMMENSMRQRIANAKTFFAYACRKKKVEINPFQDEVSSTEETDNGKVTVPKDVIERVIAAAPNVQWKLLIALWRYAGLRKMEALQLNWSDVLWEKGMLQVRSSKTAHYARKKMRYVPIRDVEPYLRDAREHAKEGDERLITQYSPTMTGLNWPFRQIIESAGLEPWPGLIKNLRMSCENDWIDAREAPDHVIAAWMGHSVKVQQSSYVQTSSGHFEQFNARPVSHSRPGSNRGSLDVDSDGISRESDSDLARTSTSENVSEQCFNERNACRSMVPTGLEPVTFRM